MEYIKYTLIALLIVSCSGDDATSTDIIITLADLVAQNDIEIDNVIACASGSENPNEIIAYVYPRPEATDLRYFETSTTTVDKDDYNEYLQIDLPTGDFFNGYLKTFTRKTVEEKWVIISFRESDSLHLSNPIRLKHQTRNTVFTDEISIDQTDLRMPLFTWDTLSNEDNAIYFQVVSDQTDELLSGTYTFEEQFQYYQLDNVVLNVTEETPPEIISDADYGFTLMGVSEDNWVNVLGQRSFVAE